MLFEAPGFTAVSYRNKNTNMSEDSDIDDARVNF